MDQKIFVDLKNVHEFVKSSYISINGHGFLKYLWIFKMFMNFRKVHEFYKMATNLKSL